MAYFGRVRVNLWLVFWCCLWAGILAGTFVGNREAGSEKRQEESILSEAGKWTDTEGFSPRMHPWRKQPGDREKFSFICRRRLNEGGMGWLIGLTACGAFCFCLFAVYMGFLLGWTITVYTLEMGIMGLPSFFLSCFPQMLLYLPAWAILLWQGLEGKAKIRPVPALLAALLLCGGAGLEAFVNPLFLG